jgi:hypothetical protein
VGDLRIDEVTFGVIYPYREYIRQLAGRAIALLDFIDK